MGEPVATDYRHRSCIITSTFPCPSDGACIILIFSTAFCVFVVPRLVLALSVVSLFCTPHRCRVPRCTCVVLFLVLCMCSSISHLLYGGAWTYIHHPGILACIVSHSYITLYSPRAFPRPPTRTLPSSNPDLILSSLHLISHRLFFFCSLFVCIHTPTFSLSLFAYTGDAARCVPLGGS